MPTITRHQVDLDVQHDALLAGGILSMAAHSRAAADDDGAGDFTEVPAADELTFDLPTIG